MNNNIITCMDQSHKNIRNPQHIYIYNNYKLKYIFNI